MHDFIYSARRVISGQPLSITVGSIRAKLRALVGGKRREAAGPAPAATHPIDQLYGIETTGFIGPGELRSGSKSDIFSSGYAGSQPSAIREAFGKIKNLETACFLDIGCGKGRALAVATEFPFRRILGVELSPALTRIAESNATVMASRFPDRTPIEVVEGDALRFELPTGFVVAFFYHPGHAPLVRGLASLFAEHQEVPGNRILVIYYNPVSANVFDNHPAFGRFCATRHRLGPEDHSDWGATHDSFVIWKARSDTLSVPHPGADERIRYSGMNAEVEA